MKKNVTILGQKGPGVCRGCEMDLRTVMAFVGVQVDAAKPNDSGFEAGNYCQACFSHVSRGTRDRLGRIEDRLAQLERSAAIVPGESH